MPSRPVIPRRILAALLVVSLVLPIAICVLLALARLLAAMNDAAGARVLERLGLAGGVLWIIGLVGLLLLLGIQSLSRPDDSLPLDE